MEKKNSEKRRHPRVHIKDEKKVASIVLKKGEEDITVSSMKNISLSGMYCRMHKYIFPLTKVEGTLQIPVHTKDMHLTLEKIIFTGVVVRIEPERELHGPHEYEVAIFFQDMALIDKEKIAHYLKSH